MGHLYTAGQPLARQLAGQLLLAEAREGGLQRESLVKLSFYTSIGLVSEICVVFLTF